MSRGDSLGQVWSSFVHFKMSKDMFYGKWRYKNIGSRVQGTSRSIYIFSREERQWIIENYKCLPMQMAHYLMDAIERPYTRETEAFQKTLWEAYAAAYNYYTALYMKCSGTQRCVSFSEVPEVRYYSTSGLSTELLQSDQMHEPTQECDSSCASEQELELLHEVHIMDISDLDLDSEQCASAEAWEVLPKKINIKYEMWCQVQSFDRESNLAVNRVPPEIMQQFDPLVDSTEESKTQPDPVKQLLEEFDPLLSKQEPQPEPVYDPLMAEQEPEQLPNQIEEVGLEGPVELDHIAQMHICPVTKQVTLFVASLEPLVISEGTQGVFIFDDGDNTDTIDRIIEVSNGDIQIAHNPEVSCHSPRRSVVTYLTTMGGSLISTLGNRAYQRIWARTEVKITVLFLGMYDILRDRLGTIKAKDFYLAFDHSIKKFVQQARESLTAHEKKAFDKRMQLHVFVLVSPKKFPSDHALMSYKDYNNFNFEITKILRSYKKDLFELYPRVMLCSPSYEYARNLHQYISRLICWRCSPILDYWTLQAKNLHIGGCDNDYEEFWPDIRNINANVHPEFLRHILKQQRWLRDSEPKGHKKKWYQKH